VLQCVEVCWSVLHCVAVSVIVEIACIVECWSVLRCVGVSCSVLK